MRTKRNKLIIRLFYLLLFLINGLVFEASSSVSYDKKFGLEMFNITVIFIVTVTSIIFVFVSLVRHLVTRSKNLKAVLAIQNIDYAREVVKLIILASPILLPIVFHYGLDLFTLASEFSTSAKQLFIAIISLFVLLVALTTSTYFAYKKSVNDLDTFKSAITHKLLSEAEIVELVVLLMTYDVVSHDVKNQITKILKQSKDLFDTEISEQKQLIITESLRSANPPVSLSF